MNNDAKIVRVSRTIGKNQVVDELILSFIHDREIEVMLPGIPPTGKYVELPHAVVMKINGNKIAHEHIYWDQGSLLTQIGALVSKKLPIAGNEQARNLLETSQKRSNKSSRSLESAHPRMNPIVNPIAIPPVKGIPKSDMGR